MIKFCKIFAFVSFFISGFCALGFAFPAAEKGEFEILMMMLVYNWIISLTVYFIGIFTEKVSRAEERLKSIMKSHNRWR